MKQCGIHTHLATQHFRMYSIWQMHRGITNIRLFHMSDKLTSSTYCTLHSVTSWTRIQQFIVKIYSFCNNTVQCIVANIYQHIYWSLTSSVESEGCCALFDWRNDLNSFLCFSLAAFNSRCICSMFLNGLISAAFVACKNY